MSQTAGQVPPVQEKKNREKKHLIGKGQKKETNDKSLHFFLFFIRPVDSMIAFQITWLNIAVIWWSAPIISISWRRYASKHRIFVVLLVKVYLNFFPQIPGLQRQTAYFKPRGNHTSRQLYVTPRQTGAFPQQ
jgi:hypothetical protein